MSKDLVTPKKKSLNQHNFENPIRRNFLVSFIDWKGFTPFSRGKECDEIFHTLDEFYRLTDNFIDSEGGRIIKYLGDSAIIIFNEDDASKGIMALFELKKKIDSWFKEKNISSTLFVNCHFGEVMIGEMGGSNFRQVDIIGQTVNICATLGRSGFLLSPQAFRCLDKESRRYFKKYTPPIVYKPV